MFPGLNGKRKQPTWLRHVVHCKPVKKAATALGSPLGRLVPPAHTRPALPAVPAADLGIGTHLSASSESAASPGRSLVAVRKDAPKAVYGVAKGTRPTTQLSNLERQRLLGNYECDVRAVSATSTSESLWHTWAFYHQRWFGANEPVLPITVQSVQAVVAQMKDQEYASIANYISIAKDKHIGHGHTWNEFLSREARRGTRSGTRGRGAAKQDEELDLDAAFTLDIGSDPLVPGGMCNFMWALEVGTFFVLREIELSTSLASAVSVNKEKLEVTVALPVSKTDPKAIGCTRTWGCVCGGQHDTPCCYHALTEQLGWLDRTFPDVARADLPLFPQSNGDAASKVSVVKSIEHIACMLGEDLVDQQGRNRFGGHSIRVTGARRLARLAIPTATIMLLARWSSFVILRYIREAPLKALTYEYRHRSEEKNTKAVYSIEDASRLISTKTRKRIQDHASDYQRHEEKLLALADRIEKIDTRTRLPQFAKNRSSGIYHRADTTNPLETGFDNRVSACGWLYHSGNCRMSDKIPTGVSPDCLCSRCLPSERAAARAALVTLSSDSDNQVAE